MHGCITLPASWLDVVAITVNQLLCLVTLAEFAYLSAGLGSTLDVANAMLPAYGASLMFTAGFFLRKPNIPVYLRW